MSMGASRKAAIKDLTKLRVICRRLYGVDIYENTREPNVSRTRQLAMYALWRRGHSYSAISDAIDRDRATVSTGVSRVIETGRIEEARRLIAFLVQDEVVEVTA